MTDDLARIEEKLDRLIRFFQIDKVPKRSRVEIRAEVDAKILRLNERKKNGRKQNTQR